MIKRLLRRLPPFARLLKQREELYDELRRLKSRSAYPALGAVDSAETSSVF